MGVAVFGGWLSSGQTVFAWDRLGPNDAEHIDLGREETQRTLRMLASLSNENRASTSVETRPGTIFRISLPNSTSCGCRGRDDKDGSTFDRYQMKLGERLTSRSRHASVCVSRSLWWCAAVAGLRTKTGEERRRRQRHQVSMDAAQGGRERRWQWQSSTEWTPCA